MERSHRRAGSPKPRDSYPWVSRRTRTYWSCLILLIANSAIAAPPAPPASITVEDRPNDAGTGLIVRWSLSPDDRAEVQPRLVKQYEILRVEGDAAQFDSVAKVNAANTEFKDDKLKSQSTYRYRVIAIAPDGATSEPVTSDAISPTIQWLDWSRIWMGAFVAFVCGAVIVCTELAKHGWSTYVRPIAGLKVIDEAVGRATEMGRPMLFVPGIMDLDQIETVAGLTVLSKVAQTAADYDAALEVPTTRSLVMTAAREAVQSAYLAAGRPDSFDQDRVYYVTDEQFGYVAYCCGWMAREKPAACFYLGKFFAESLILAEVGNSVGAIQLAGTAEAAQLPFFVAACDYTLLGEELFAASAYLSGEPQQLGTLKGQDVAKVLAAVLIVLGCLLATAVALHPNGPATPLYQYFRSAVLNKGEA
jgi:hypothetical protein